MCFLGNWQAICFCRLVVRSASTIICYVVNRNVWFCSRSRHSSPSHDTTSTMFYRWACMFMIMRRSIFFSILWPFHHFAKCHQSIKLCFQSSSADELFASCKIVSILLCFKSLVSKSQTMDCDIFTALWRLQTVVLFVFPYFFNHLSVISCFSWMTSLVW